MRTIDDQLDVLPPVVPGLPLDQLTPAELLSDSTRVALLKQRAIISQALKLKQCEGDELTAEDLKLQRLVSDTAGSVLRASVRVQEALWREKREEGFKDILAELLKVK